jgi:hypothetical protein
MLKGTATAVNGKLAETLVPQAADVTEKILELTVCPDTWLAA